MQVDGTHGSAIVGLRKCWAQSIGTTPRPTWNPDIDQPVNFFNSDFAFPDTTGGPIWLHSAHLLKGSVHTVTVLINSLTVHAILPGR
jgi:hypothetical protein